MYFPRCQGSSVFLVQESAEAAALHYRASCSPQDTLTQRVEATSAVHRALYELQSVYLAFSLAVAIGQSQRGLHTGV